MSVLRDVIARFQVEVDTKPLTDLDKRLNKARESVNSMGKYALAGMAAAAYGVYQFTEAASHADEMLNVIQASFKGNAKAILDWSKTMGKELGRSEYSLQEYAGSFGSVLDPMFKNTDKDISAMSKQLSALTVDLASFYDTSDEEAMIRLKSGMAGETEAVRRLGIDISDAALRDMHEKSGAPGQYKSLSTADKTWLRFQKILMDTTNAQGDAARTANGWANSVKRVQERWKTFTIEVGKGFKRFLLPVLHEFESWIPTLESLVKDSSALEAGFRLVAYSLGILGAAFVALNAPMLVMATTALAAALIFEDILTFLDGGDTVIGRFIADLTGTHDPLQLWNRSLNRFIGGMDIFIAGIRDMAELIVWITSGGARGDYDNDHVRAARKRAGADDANRKGVEAGLDSQRMALLSDGEGVTEEDKEAFKKTFAGSTMTSDQLTEQLLAYRKRALAGGARANLDDVASNLVSQRWVDSQQAVVGPPTAQQYANGQTAGAGAAAGGTVVMNVTINGTGLSKEELEEATAAAGRKTAAALGEEK